MSRYRKSISFGPFLVNVGRSGAGNSGFEGLRHANLHRGRWELVGNWEATVTDQVGKE